MRRVLKVVALVVLAYSVLPGSGIYPIYLSWYSTISLGLSLYVASEVV